ncbi:putative O-glycosylation ligase, exosortase A system-associated [Alteromonadaceae bacterium M269]|nr:putative O-glycosylation ligase, exosortase A system-associated [Alteromonadaceae bacterium M269]
MRDVLVVSLFLAMIVVAFRKPIGGLCVWVWTSFITPNFFLYGFGNSIRFNLIAALMTITSFMMFTQKKEITKHSLATTVYVFFGWSLITAIFAIHDSPDIAFISDAFFRAMVLFVFILFIIKTENQFRVICIAFCLSLGFYSVAEGLKYFLSGGGHRIVGPANSALTDNNHFALGINMMIPFLLALHAEFKQKYLKLAIVGVILTSILTVMGTNSRGGFIGLMVIGGFYFLHSKKKLLIITLVLILGGTVISLVPDNYFARIDTINNAQEDLSFLGRVVAWKQSILIALDNPITGGGFNAVQTASVWYTYAPDFDTTWLMNTPHPIETGVKAAHSIYFQVLGDQGFTGIILFCFMLYFSIIKSYGVMKYRPPDSNGERVWVNSWGQACFLSMVVYSIGGALLSLAYFELLYLVLALICVLDAEVKKQKAQSLIATS